MILMSPSGGHGNCNFECLSTFLFLEPSSLWPRARLTKAHFVSSPAPDLGLGRLSLQALGTWPRSAYQVPGTEDKGTEIAGSEW